MRTGTKLGKDDKHMFDENIDKLKAAKCYVKEVNKNREEDIEEDQKCLSSKKVEIHIGENEHETPPK